MQASAEAVLNGCRLVPFPLAAIAPAAAHPAGPLALTAPLLLPIPPCPAAPWP